VGKEKLVLFGSGCFGGSLCSCFGGFFSCRSFFSGGSLGSCRCTVLFFKLEAQCVDDACSGGSRSLEDACNLGELQLAGLECCQGSDFARVQCLALEVTGLDNQLLVGLGKIRQALGSGNCVTLDERDCSGAGELVVECFNSSFLGCNGGQGVLYDRELGVLAERDTQLLELCNGEPTVFGQDSGVRFLEIVSDLSYC
jgi:hypothetical protein